MIIAIKYNLGGLGDFVESIASKIKVGFEALKQLFSQGGFSGAIAAEMDKAENSGLRRFVIRLYQIGFRIMKFFEGFKAGFAQTLDAMGPTFDRLTDAFRGLGEALGIVGTKGQDAVAGLPSEKFAEKGARIAAVVARVVGWIADIISTVVEYMSGFIEGITGTFDALSPIFEGLKIILSDVGDQFGGLLDDLGLFTDSGESKAKTFGKIMGGIIGGLVSLVAAAITGILTLVDGVIRAVRFLGDVWGAIKSTALTIGLQIGQFFQNMVDDIMNSLDNVLVFIGDIVGRIPARFRPDALDSVVASGQAAAIRVNERTSRGQVRNRLIEQKIAETQAAAAAPNAAQQRTIENAAIAKAVAGEIEKSRLKDKQEIVLQIDGETVARHVAQADRKAGGRAFVPGTPAEVD